MKQNERFRKPQTISFSESITISSEMTIYQQNLDMQIGAKSSTY